MTNRTDNFNRADSTLSINSPSDGGSDWTIPTGTGVWGISSNQGYAPVSVAQDICVLESSISDCDVQVTFPTVSTNPGLVARETDDNNYFVVTGTGGPWTIRKRAAGTFTTQATGTGNAANGDVVRLNCNGQVLTLFVNGTQNCQATGQSFNQTATKHGIRTSSDTASRFDDFSITALTGVVTSWAHRFARMLGGAMAS